MELIAAAIAGLFIFALSREQGPSSPTPPGEGSGPEPSEQKSALEQAASFLPTAAKTGAAVGGAGLFGGGGAVTGGGAGAAGTAGAATAAGGAGTGGGGAFISGQAYGAGSTGGAAVATVAGGLAVSLASGLLNRQVFNSDRAGVVGALNPTFGTGANIGAKGAQELDKAFGTSNELTQGYATVAGSAIGFVATLVGGFAAAGVATIFIPAYAVLKWLGVGGSGRPSPEEVRKTYEADWQKKAGEIASIALYAENAKKAQRFVGQFGGGATILETSPQVAYGLVPFVDGYMREVNHAAFRAFMAKKPAGVPRLGWATQGYKDGFFTGTVAPSGELRPPVARWTQNPIPTPMPQVPSREWFERLGKTVANLAHYQVHMRQAPTKLGAPGAALAWATVGARAGRFTGAVLPGGELVTTAIEGVPVGVDETGAEVLEYGLAEKPVDWRALG